MHENAHRIEGALANVGATAAREAAGRREHHGRAGETRLFDEAATTLEAEMHRLEPALRALVTARSADGHPPLTRDDEPTILWGPVP